jgi:hypothetical protein
LRLAHFCQFGGVLLLVLQNLHHLPGRPISTTFAPNLFSFGFQINAIIYSHLCSFERILLHFVPVKWSTRHFCRAFLPATVHKYTTSLGVLSPPLLLRIFFRFVFRSILPFTLTPAALSAFSCTLCLESGALGAFAALFYQLQYTNTQLAWASLLHHFLTDPLFLSDTHQSYYFLSLLKLSADYLSHSGRKVVVLKTCPPYCSSYGAQSRMSYR